MKRYLTLDDLYQFYFLLNRDCKFSAKNDNGCIVVQEMGYFDSSSNDTKMGLLPVSIKACHINLNRNGSYISKKNMEKALPTIYNRPILGNIIQLDDGTYDFHSHDFEIDDDGNEHYIEKPIGIIPESGNAHLEYDEEMDKTYVVVDGFIYEDYGNEAAEIILNKESNKVSVELCINELSYNAKEKYLEITDFYFNGITCLGKEKDGREIGEGMLGSKLKLGDFSKESNSIVSNVGEELLLAIDKLNTTLSNFQINTNTQGEGGYTQVKLQELLEKYSKTMDDITFETEGLSDEELENKFKEAFEDGNTDSSDGSENTDTSDGSEGETTELTEPELTEPGEGSGDGEDGDGDGEGEGEGEGGEDTKLDPDEGDDDDDDEPEKDPVVIDDTEEKRKRKYTLETDGHTMNFEVSLDEILYALQTVVNDTYSETDNTYYSVKAYDKYVVMIDCWNGRAYKQNYKSRNGVYSLTGDRVEVYARYLTKEEDAALDEMRTKYSDIESKLQTYVDAENAEKKKTILESEDYELVRDSDMFKALVEDSENMSVEEVSEKADEILLSYVKSNNKFSHKSQVKVNKFVNIGAKKEENYSPYGSLFKDMK